MEIYDGFETIKQKLIIAGMQEIENHGITDFSLRRVASLCNVSCAAPYKHFKSKEDFIGEIAIYIHKQWLLLQNQISTIFSHDPSEELIELCVAYIKFWIANPNFHSVLMLKASAYTIKNTSVMYDISHKILELINKLHHTNSEKQKKCIFMIRSILYGATTMIDNGELEISDETLDMIRDSIRNLI